MPTINIPPKIRFALYLLGALSLLTVSYAVDKSWAGDAEIRYVTGLAALVNLLAMAKTNLSDTPVVLTGSVEQTGPAAGDFEATLEPTDEHGHMDATMAFVMLCLIALVLVASRLG